MFNLLGIIIGKELKDGLRDRRALLTLFFSPVLFLILMVGMVFFFLAMQERSESFKLPVQGGEYAQPLLDWLREEGIDAVPLAGKVSEGEAARQVENREIEFALVIPADFPRDFHAFESPRIELIYDRSRNDVQGKIFRIKTAVQQWNSRIGSLRLIARGVSPRLATPLVLEDVDVADGQKLASRFFGVIPLMLVMTIFMSSIGLSVDMMAGEREKQSLEPLMLNPVSRELIVLGKWLAAICCTLLVVVLTVLALFVLVPLLPLERLGLQYQLSAGQLLQALLVSLPLIGLATIVQLLLSIMAKSFKEAQSYISLLVTLPMFVAYYVLFTDVNQGWQVWVPLLGPLVILEEIFLGESVALRDWLIVIGGTALLAAIVAALVAIQLRRERIIYG